MAYTQTFNDATLIQPVNQTSWENVFGDVDHYDLKSIAVTWSGSNVTFAIHTKDNATPAFSVDYIADLAIDKNRDGIWETGIIMKTDTRRGTTLPGAQAGTAGTVFTLAGATNNSHWYRTNQPPFSEATSRDYAMYFDQNNGIGTRSKKRIPVLLWANSSYTTFAGSVTWTHLSDYLVTITLTGINTDGSWNNFDLLWGTETCGNDVQYKTNDYFFSYRVAVKRWHRLSSLRLAQA